MSKKFRFHHLAVPHNVTHHDYVACAYQSKVLKFARMMTQLGHEVIHYGHERSELECTEHVTVTDDAVLQQAYGDHDWRRHQFRHNITDHAYTEFARRAIPQVRARAQPGEFLLCNFGTGHQAIADAVPELTACEPGVGYTTGHFARWRAYESHAVRNIVEGHQNPQNWYSWVIPNYFDARDFDYSDRKSDYVLFLGRVSELKGISTCIRATAAAGVRLVIAGQGRIADVGWTQTPAHVTELGYADRELRRELMRDARALIIATTYNEPFGGVVVEALLSGTPIITPHFGAFAEIQNGRTGFQCHTLREYRDAILKIDQISHQDCRARGEDYLLERVGPQFERWFTALDEIYTGQGWAAL
jgi:glycosyltransferase involved in cell wall biosynthesis